MPRRAPRDDVGDEHLRVERPGVRSAGIPGIVESARHLVRQVGAARGARTMLHVNQPDGFDCPGCAWPEPGETSHFEFCENGAKAVAEEATRRRVDAAFFAQHPIAELAERSDYWLGQQGRLTEPMLKAEGDDRYRPISWDGAFDIVAAALHGLPDPDRAVFYTSGRTSNEAAFLYQLFVRMLGTNNLPDCSNMCHESSGFALGATLGTGKGTVSLDDVHHAELLLIAGQNPGTNHPRMLSALETAKRNGARIVAINPLPEAGLKRFRNPQRIRGLIGGGTELADLYLPVKVGADQALFQLLCRGLVEADDRGEPSIDRDFVETYCDGYDELAAHLRAVDAAALLDATSLASTDVDTLAGWLSTSTRIIVCWAMGLTQHRNAVGTIQDIVNLLLLRGAIGKPGAGACPVRGHSNVQGDRTMGIFERPAATFLDALRDEFGFDPPREHGYDTVGAIHAMAAGDVDVFVGMGGNFVAAAPDTDETAAALAKCGLTVQISTKLNRSHVQCGRAALILPCLGRTEADTTGGKHQLVTVEDSMGVVHGSRGRNDPASATLRSEVGIVCALAERTLPEGSAPWSVFAADYAQVRHHIANVVPGFDDFDNRVREKGGFALPNTPHDRRVFPTATGRARLTVNHFRPIVVPPGRLLLQTIRSHDQFNTTIYGLDDRYRGIHGGRHVVFVNDADIRSLGLEDGAMVDIVGEWRDHRERHAKGFRVVAYPTPEGTSAAYFPEANVLVPLDSVAEGSRTPTSKAVVVHLERA